LVSDHTDTYLPACICPIVSVVFSFYLQIADDAHNILTAISPGEPGLGGFPLIFLVHLFLDSASSWDRPEITCDNFR